MKKLIMISIGFLIVSSCFPLEKTILSNKKQNISFVQFVNKFDVLPLPFNLLDLNDLQKYADNIIQQTNSKTIIVPNPLCPLIYKCEYKYINKINSNTNDNQYRRLYKRYTTKLILLLIKQTNNLTGDYSFNLNSYSLSGKLIDTLTLAGQKIDDYDQFCSIDSSLAIKIRIIKGLPQTQKPGEPSPNIEINKEYIITPDGYFKQTFYNQKQGYYRLIKGKWICVDSKK